MRGGDIDEKRCSGGSDGMESRLLLVGGGWDVEVNELGLGEFYNI